MEIEKDEFMRRLYDAETSVLEEMETLRMRAAGVEIKYRALAAMRDSIQRAERSGYALRFYEDGERVWMEKVPKPRAGFRR